MDSLLVDLDKVLDDLEKEEESVAPGNEIKPSGFQQYLEQSNQQTWNTIEDVMAPAISKPYTQSSATQGFYTTGPHPDVTPAHAESLRYDFPYEPEKFDMSEADFGASPLEDSGYRGSLSYTSPPASQGVTRPGAAQGGGLRLENGFSSLPEPGTPYENVKPAFPSYPPYDKDRPQSLQINYDKMPIDGGLPPGMKPHGLSFQQHNGHSMETETLHNGFTDKSDSVPQLSSIPSLSGETSSNAGLDKYPVQCNTPQTPKENPLLNPFATHLNGNVTISNGNFGQSDQINNAVDTVHPHNAGTVMQNGIPKLENLKHDLEKSVGISAKNVDGKSMKNFSQSLPAWLHGSMVMNGGLSCSSLPSELGDKVSHGNMNTVGHNSNELLHRKQSDHVTVATHSGKDFTNSDVRASEQQSAHAAIGVSNSDAKNGMSVGSVEPDTNLSTLQLKSEAKIPGQDVSNPVTDSQIDDNGYMSSDHQVMTSNSSGLDPNMIPLAGNPAQGSETAFTSEQSTGIEHKAVGFGRFGEDINVDDDDLNEYLGDNSQTKSAPENVQLTKHADHIGEQKDLTNSVVDKLEGEDELKPVVGVKDSILTSDQMCNRTGLDVKGVSVGVDDKDRGQALNVQMEQLSEQSSHQESCDLEVLKVLSNTLIPASGSVIAQPVIGGLPQATATISPDATISLDSGCASMQDQTHVDSESAAGATSNRDKLVDTGARPKDINVYNQSKMNKPGDTMDTSRSSAVINSVGQTMMDLSSGANQNVIATMNDPPPPYVEHLANDPSAGRMLDSRQLMDPGGVTTCGNEQLSSSNPQSDLPSQALGAAVGVGMSGQLAEPQPHLNPGEMAGVEMRNPSASQAQAGSVEDSSAVTGRPQSWGPSESGQAGSTGPSVKQRRPTSLNLPPPPTIDPHTRPEEEGLSPEPAGDGETGAEGSSTDTQQYEGDCGNIQGAEGGSDQPYVTGDPTDPRTLLANPMGDPLGPPPPYVSGLGHTAPKWIPDAEAPVCMSCEMRFTFTKRRHHCRACGKVFCSSCCSIKHRLPYMKNQEARVCVMCHSELELAEQSGLQGYPHPSNPSDYCSVVPPSQAAGQAGPQPPPSVLVPVLKRDGSGNSRTAESSNRRTEPKQVMFSDGIRPGGDLTELDGSSEVSRQPPRRSRPPKRAAAQGQHSGRSRRLRTVAERTTKCLIPDDGLPPLTISQPDGQGNMLQVNPDPAEFMPMVKAEEKEPVIFAINTNLFVLVKIVTLDCCISRTVWCFTTRGMTSVGQEEIVVVLEVLPGESSPPRDIFVHLNNVFEDACKGNVIVEMGHSIFNQSFLDSRDHGGFLYIRSTFQCTQKLVLPSPPHLFAILLQKWETPWAKVFPLRLLLRLGAEYRYYPCPLIGNRSRKPVFYEIGHTIMNLLADFRNYQYMLPNIRGITIHMEDKVTKINFPRNRYEDLMKVVNNSNEHVMAIGATFSSEADSHLVCIQNEEGNYQTQAINIQNKPRKVTGASFVVFNGALKTSSGLTAKSSIVEDGLMVQITPDSMLALKQAIRDMHDYPINCGVLGAAKPDETVIVQWAEDDKNVNIGVRSPVDNMEMDGIDSLRIKSSTDHVGERHIIRWTEIFFLQNEERGSPKWDPVDLSRIGETVATACCQALTQHLDKLKEAGLDRIGLRISLGNDNVGYEAGSRGERLPDVYMNDLDNELIPVIHRATQPDTMIQLELIFEVLAV